MAAPLVPKEDIRSYIPQRDPIVMIDTIEQVEQTRIETSLEIREDNMFVKDGRLTEPGLIENIAQTAAARAGYEVKKKGAEPLVGFIGAVKDLRIHFLPKTGDLLKTRVDVKTEVMGVTIIEGVSTVDNQVAAQCEMKIFIRQPNDEKKP